jgi:hypothetical protein
MLVDAPAPLLALHVKHIVGMAAEKEMGGIAAHLIVTSVQHARLMVSIPLRDIPIRQDPGHAMRTDWDALNTEVAISAAVYRSCPRPALIRPAPINLGPKPIPYRLPG